MKKLAVLLLIAFAAGTVALAAETAPMTGTTMAPKAPKGKVMSMKKMGKKKMGKKMMGKKMMMKKAPTMAPAVVPAK